MSKYDNFARNDIFKKDSQGNSVYFMMGQLSPGIIVNDSITQNKLVDLEGYKYFFLPFHKNKNFLKSRGLIIPPIIIPILVFTFLVLVISSILFPELKIIETDKDFGLIMFIMGFSSYIIIGLTYLRKIQKLLKGLPLISKKEKTGYLIREELPKKIPLKKQISIQVLQKKNLNLNFVIFFIR